MKPNPRPPVKRTRNTPRKPGPFGAGILASRPIYRRTWTDTDAAWAAVAFAPSAYHPLARRPSR